MGRGDIDGFEELGHEMETVLGSVQESEVLCNLIHPLLASDKTTTKYTETNLLQPVNYFFQCDRGTPYIPKDTKYLQPCKEFRLQEIAEMGDNNNSLSSGLGEVDCAKTDRRTVARCRLDH